jgi:hypothetical protein
MISAAQSRAFDEALYSCPILAVGQVVTGVATSLCIDSANTEEKMVEVKTGAVFDGDA